MTTKGQVIGYSINYIRADDVQDYFAAYVGFHGSTGPPPQYTPITGVPVNRVDPNMFPLVVPFIIRPGQAARNPYVSPPGPPGMPTLASQEYIAAGNLFQPHGTPVVGGYPGDAYGSYEWFNDVYRTHMTFKPGDLITVGAIKNTSAAFQQNCQVTVYIKLDQP